MEGNVKFFNESKGFGFVTGNDGQEYFIHITALKPGTRLKENDAVTFDPVKADRGLQAQNVALASEGGASKPQEEKEPEEEVEDSEDF